MTNNGTLGGPYDTEETCKVCGKVWTRHHKGPLDVLYQDCMDCYIKEKFRTWKSTPDPEEKKE